MASEAIYSRRGSCLRRPVLSVFVPEEIEANRLPLGKVRIPVVAAAVSGEGFITSVSATVLGRTQETRTKSPLTPLDLRPEQVRAGLDLSDLEVIREVSEHGAYQDVYVDLAGAPIADGDRTSVSVTVEAVVSGRKVRETVRIPLHMSSLPKVPGWYGGDGHVHTWWSPDVILLPMSERARYAKDNGFGFIVMTDHEDGIGRKWGSTGGYCAQCLAAEEEFGLPVLPGVEIAVAGGGHCLAYCMRETAISVPSNRAHNACDLLWRIAGHNRPYSYGIAAHPCERRERWNDWSAQGISGLEIINRSRKARTEAVSQWFALLNRNLARTLRTGEFMVGLANSDCHNLREPGSRGFTWISVDTVDAVDAVDAVDGAAKAAAGEHPHSLDRRSVWEAIGRGRVVASGSKDLGFFTLNGSGIGSVVNAQAGSTLTLDIRHYPSGGRRCRKIAVISGDGREAVLIAGRPGVPIRFEVECPSTSTFYVTKFDFSGTGRRRASEVWTNPVFVRVAE